MQTFNHFSIMAQHKNIMQSDTLLVIVLSYCLCNAVLSSKFCKLNIFPYQYCATKLLLIIFFANYMDIFPDSMYHIWWNPCLQHPVPNSVQFYKQHQHYKAVLYESQFKVLTSARPKCNRHSVLEAERALSNERACASLVIRALHKQPFTSLNPHKNLKIMFLLPSHSFF